MRLIITLLHKHGAIHWKTYSSCDGNLTEILEKFSLVYWQNGIAAVFDMWLPVSEIYAVSLKECPSFSPLRKIFRDDNHLTAFSPSTLHKPPINEKAPIFISETSTPVYYY